LLFGGIGGLVLVVFGYLVGLVIVGKGLVKVGGWGMVLKAK